MIYRRLAPYVAAVQLFSAVLCYSQDNKNTTHYLQTPIKEKADNNLKQGVADHSLQNLEERAMPFFTIKEKDADQQQIQEGTIIYTKKPAILKKKTTSFYNIFLLEKVETDYLQQKQEKTDDYQPTFKKEKTIYPQMLPRKLKLNLKNVQKSGLEKKIETNSQEAKIKTKKFYQKWWFWTGLGLLAAGIYYYNQNKESKKLNEPTTSSDDKDEEQDPAHELSLRLNKRF